MKKIPNTANHQGNANINHNKTSAYPHKMVIIKKTEGNK
jgi:hypothetical protein